MYDDIMKSCVTITTSVWWHFEVMSDFHYISMVPLCSQVWLLLHLFDDIVLSCVNITTTVWWQYVFCVLFTSSVWWHYVVMSDYYYICTPALWSHVWLSHICLMAFGCLCAFYFICMMTLFSHFNYDYIIMYYDII